ncbi:MAG: flippase-like domain-containing protein [Alphaproteobacteria bacterium]|nr:flippase-like domain-containing protein [Alphaproteobacteria bacterium]
MKNGVRTIVKVLVAVFIFWLISRFVDLGEAAAMIIAADPIWLIAAALLGLPFALLESTRWIVLMRAMGQVFPFKASLIYTLVGWFFNIVSPANTGQDVFRAVQMTRLGMDKGMAVRSVIIYRFTSFWSLILVVLAAFPFAMSYAHTSANQIILSILVAMSCGLMGSVLCLDVIRHILPKSFAREITTKLLSPFRQLRSVLFQSDQSFQISLCGVAVHMWRVLIILFLAYALNIQTSYGELFLFAPLALLVAMVPITVSDWGTREAAFAFFLPWISVSAEQAVGLSVLFGLYRIFNGIPGAFVWFLSDKSSYAVPGNQ